MRAVSPVPVVTRPDDVTRLLPQLAAALDGTGPALHPHLPGHPLTVTAAGAGDDVALVVATSGSTGRPRGVALPASALRAAARATHDRLATDDHRGGPGRWLLALPLHHIAGLQVLVRSVVGGTEPAVLDLTTPFTAAGFARACRTADARYTSLVPTQLARVLDDADATAALAGFDAVLIGGASLPPALHAAARAAGVRVVTTYGMTETCGGCVYDGRPLRGVRVRIGEHDRIAVGGDTLASGYLPELTGPELTGPELTGPDVTGPTAGFRTESDGTRWLLTGDAGRWDGDRLVVLGRLDDAVLTGGVTVHPSAVEAALTRLDAVAEAVVVGVPDEEWGRRVVAAVVLRPGAGAPDLAAVRAHVTGLLEPAAAPRQLLVLDALPLRGPGKPDRDAIAALAHRGPDAPGPDAPGPDAPGPDGA